MKRSFNKIEKAAKKHGGSAQLIYGGNWITIWVDAPQGKIWSCASIHTLKVEWRWKDTVSESEAVKDALERIAEGVTDCDNPECDTCHG